MGCSHPSVLFLELEAKRVVEGRKIHFKLGSGDSIFLWHDSWHPLGPMFEKFGPRALYDLASGIISFRVNIEWLMEAAPRKI